MPGMLARNLLIARSTQLAAAGRAFSSSAARASAATTRRVKLTLYTGPQCSLCDDAKELIAAARKEAAETGGGNAGAVESELELYNIRDESLADVHRWRRAYQYDIPVLHLNGEGECPLISLSVALPATPD